MGTRDLDQSATLPHGVRLVSVTPSLPPARLRLVACRGIAPSAHRSFAGPSYRRHRTRGSCCSSHTHCCLRRGADTDNPCPQTSDITCLAFIPSASIGRAAASVPKKKKSLNGEPPKVFPVPNDDDVSQPKSNSIKQRGTKRWPRLRSRGIIRI